MQAYFTPRYADNRCFFLRHSEHQRDWAQLALQLDFDGLPIELETVQQGICSDSYLTGLRAHRTSIPISFGHELRI